MPRCSRAARRAGFSSGGSGAVRAARAGSPARCASSSPTSRSSQSMNVPVRLDEDGPRRVDSRQVSARGSDDRIESPDGLGRDTLAALARLPVVADDYNLPARELEHRSVNPREPQLEHAPRPASEQLEDPRSRGGGERWRHSTHAETLAFEHRGAAGAAEITPVEPDPGHAGEGSGLVPRALT